MSVSKVLWDDVVGEPEGIRSPECVWRLSHQCFKHSRNCCYTLLTVLLAPFTAVCLGFGFACLAFEVSFLEMNSLRDKINDLTFSTYGV